MQIIIFVLVVIAAFIVFLVISFKMWKKSAIRVMEDGELIETTSGLNAEDDDKGLKICRNETSGVMVGRNGKAKKHSKEKTKQFVSKVFNLNDNVDAKKKVKAKMASTGYNIDR